MQITMFIQAFFNALPMDIQHIAQTLLLLQRKGYSSFTAASAHTLVFWVFLCNINHLQAMLLLLGVCSHIHCLA